MPCANAASGRASRRDGLRTRETLRVQFAHGLEGSPQGGKARLLAAHFTALTPAMDTRDFDACVALHAQALRRFRPDLLVGSSFGAGVVLELLQRSVWRGPTLLLAQAALARGQPAWLPEDVHVWLVHGLRDAIVPPDQSRRLARSGSAERVRLIELDDDHPLGELVRSGRLAGLVWELACRAGVAR